MGTTGFDCMVGT